MMVLLREVLIYLILDVSNDLSMLDRQFLKVHVYYSIKQYKLLNVIIHKHIPSIKNIYLSIPLILFLSVQLFFMGSLILLQRLYIVFMTEYLNQYYPQAKTNDNIEHYRIQIKKLQQKQIQKSTQYEKRIRELQGELKHHRKPIFQNSTIMPNKANNDLNYEVFQKDNQIKQLKTQNTKLRQIINNPDQILIKKNNNFEIVTEKDNEINRLRKALMEIQSKYDGQFFSESKMKKEFEMLRKENESLKLKLIRFQKERQSFNKDVAPDQLLDNLRLKKQLQASQKQVQQLNKVIQYQDVKNLQLSRVSLNNNDRRQSRKVGGLGSNTQLEEVKLELQQFKVKNRELNRKVNDLTEQNERLLTQRKRALQLKNSRQNDLTKKSMNNLQQQQSVIKYLKNRQTVRASLYSQSNKESEGQKNNARYAQLGIDQDYLNRGIKKQ